MAIVCQGNGPFGDLLSLVCWCRLCDVGQKGYSKLIILQLNNRNALHSEIVCNCFNHFQKQS